MVTRASIVIPAHNEAAVIDECLGHLLADAGPGEFEVIVAVNGSSDDTAARARAAGADVIELVTPSKTAALRAADAHATVFPRIYLDADVTLTPEAARAIAAELDTDAPRAAGARMVVDTSACSAPARAYFRIWAQTDYRTAHMIGSGVYAVNATGHARIADWPLLIADDLFVQRSFTIGERRIADADFIARPPTTLRAQIRRATRWQRGNTELDRYAAAHPGHLRMSPPRPAAPSAHFSAAYSPSRASGPTSPCTSPHTLRRLPRRALRPRTPTGAAPRSRMAVASRAGAAPPRPPLPREGTAVRRGRAAVAPGARAHRRPERAARCGHDVIRGLNGAEWWQCRCTRAAV